MIKILHGWTKQEIYKKYIQNGRFESDFVCLENFIIELKRVNLLQAKTYWSIFKTFYISKKIPLIPLLLADDRFVTDIKTKSNIFNE